MALVRQHRGEPAQFRPGDAVFSWKENAQYPLHVGVFRRLNPDGQPVVLGVPSGPRGETLGETVWSGTKGQYRADMTGQHLEVDRAQVALVSLIAEQMLLDHSQLQTECEWAPELVVRKPAVAATGVRDGIPVVVRSSCAQFVGFLYQHAGIPLVPPDARVHPADPDPECGVNFLPALQAHVFWTATYGVIPTADVAAKRYESCCTDYARENKK